MKKHNEKKEHKGHHSSMSGKMEGKGGKVITKKEPSKAGGGHHAMMKSGKGLAATKSSVEKY